MKKKVLVAVFVLAPLFSVMAVVPLVSLVEANPLWFLENPPPDEYTKPPVISIFSPENNTVFNTDNLVLSFKVDVGESETALTAVLSDVWYETDWQQDNVDPLYSWTSSSFSGTVNLTAIPEGKHNITVQAIERGTYTNRHRFMINSSETIFFTINTNPDKIPEFPAWMILPLLLVTTLMVMVYRKKLHKTPKQQSY